MSPTSATKKWVQDFVVRLGLCPFAAKPMLEQAVRFVEVPHKEIDLCFDAFLAEVLRLSEKPASEVMTTLLIYPDAFPVFELFLDFIDASLELLSQAGADELVQLAHFHPNYQFAGVTVDDPSNLTNRSPYPIVQLLRVKEVTKAIASYPDIEAIPDQNIALMRKMAGKF